MPQDRKPLPEQTAHKTWASYVAGLAASVIVGLGARWGLELGEDTTIALMIVLTPMASAFATWLKRNHAIDTGTMFCHPLPVIAAIGLALLLTGCEAAQKAFPRTSAGFEEGGVVGAVGGAAEGAAAIAERVYILCETLDGAPVRVPVDILAAAAGQTDTLEIVREVRHRICASVGLVGALAPETSPIPAPRP